MNESQEHGSTSIEKGQSGKICTHHPLTNINVHYTIQTLCVYVSSICLFIYLFIVILTIRDLVDIVRVLKDGSFQTIKWFDLGLYLGLIHNDLKVIETNYPRDAERCLRECLAKWLTDDIEATWNKLAIAVGEVGETSVAEYIHDVSESIIND